jgi:hypothetical protein
VSSRHEDSKVSAQDIVFWGNRTFEFSRDAHSAWVERRYRLTRNYFVPGFPGELTRHIAAIFALAVTARIAIRSTCLDPRISREEYHLRGSCVRTWILFKSHDELEEIGGLHLGC